MIAHTDNNNPLTLPKLNYQNCNMVVGTYNAMHISWTLEKNELG